MKTFRKSSLISSVALLLVAIVALSGATFAWFSSNPNATATGVKTSATAASGLLITTDATDADSWTNAVTLYEGENAKSLTPVSTNFDVPSAPAWFTATAASANSYEADDNGFTAVGDTTAYVDSYTIYAKTQDGVSKDLYVTAAIAETVGKFGRVAIVSGNTVLYYKDGVAVTEGVATDTETWAPINKDGAEATTLGFTATSSIANAKIGTIPENGTLAISIYVWNEGQDPGCTTNTSTEALTANFTFSLNNTTN